MTLTLRSTGGRVLATTTEPVLFYEPTEGEWSVMLPNGDVLSDISALQGAYHDDTVAYLGGAARVLNLRMGLAAALDSADQGWSDAPGEAGDGPCTQVALATITAAARAFLAATP